MEVPPHPTTRTSGKPPRRERKESPALQERVGGRLPKNRRSPGAAGASPNGALPPSPGTPGVNRSTGGIQAQHCCPTQASTTSPRPAGTSALAALPENTYQKASNFTRAPKEGETSPQAGLWPVHIPPGAPAPRNTHTHPPPFPRSAPPRTTPWAGREGEPRFQGPLNTDGIFLAASKRDQKEPRGTTAKNSSPPGLVREPPPRQPSYGEGTGTARSSTALVGCWCVLIRGAILAWMQFR